MLWCCGGDTGKRWALKKSAAGRSESRLVGERLNRVSEEREVSAACLGCLLELPRYWLSGIREVLVGAASGRCGLEVYRDPSCLIGEAPESRMEVRRSTNSLGSIV